MTKRIVSGIFILTALGALGVILAGALTSGEQLIVRFLTAVIVAALGLYVISDLRLQADDDAMTARSNSHPRLASVDAPPNSTAAFMATVTRRGEHKTGEIDVTTGPVTAGSDEKTDQQMVGAGATTSSATESTSAAVEDAESIAETLAPQERASTRPPAPETVRTDVFGPPADTGLSELFAANGSVPRPTPDTPGEPISYDLGGANRPAGQAAPGVESPDAMPSVFDGSDGDRRTAGADTTTADLADLPPPASEPSAAAATQSPNQEAEADDDSANQAPATADSSEDSSATADSADLVAATTESPDDTAVLDALEADYERPLRQAELAVAAMTGSTIGDSDRFRGSSLPGDGANLSHSPSNGSPGRDHDRNGSPANGAPGNGSPFSAPPATGRRPNGTPRRLLDSIEGFGDIAGIGRPLNQRYVNGPQARPAETPGVEADDSTPATDTEPSQLDGTAAATQDPSTSAATPAGFEYSDELHSPVGEWPAPPAGPVGPAPQPHPFEKASAAYQAEKDRLAAAGGADLPVVSPRHGLEAADYADAPLAPIIDLRHVNSHNPTSVDAAINAGEVEVIATLIEQGMLSTEGPISDRDVRTMVYVAFTSNELRKLLLAGGTPDGPNVGLDLGPVELFDERLHAPAPKTLYAGTPPQHAQSQIG